MKEIDYKYCLDFLNKINRIKIDGQSICDFFSFDNYDFWQMRQQNIFSRLKLLSAENYKNTNSKLTLKGFCVFVFALFFTLLSCLALFFKKRKVLVYSTDLSNGKFKNDARIDEIYKFLFKNNLNFVEYFHSLFDRKFLKNLFKRKRFALYPESLNFIPIIFFKNKKILNFESDDIFSDTERLFVLDIVNESVIARNTLKFQIKISKILLKISSINKVLLIDDVRHYWSVLIAAEQLKIPTYSFQHGHFTKYHVGWLNMTNSEYDIPQPTKFLLWSNYWKDELLRLGGYFSEPNIISASKEIIDNNFAEKEKINQIEINILIPYETDAPKNEVFNFLNKLSEFEDINLYFKIRTDISEKKQIEDYSLNRISNVNVISDTNGIDFDMVAGVYSTFLYDMVYKLIPVAIFQTSMDYGMGMIENDVADLLVFDSDLYGQIDRISKTSDFILNQRKSKVYESDTIIEHFLEEQLI